MINRFHGAIKIFCCNSVHFSQLFFIIIIIIVSGYIKYGKMIMKMTITLMINDDDVVRVSSTPVE